VNAPQRDLFAAVPPGSAWTPPRYAELHCVSNFTFLRGASSAHELIERAAKLGYAALAVTDECTLAGIVRAHEAAKKFGVKLIVGTEVQAEDGPRLVLLAADHDGYTAICRLVTDARRAAKKGTYRLTRAALESLGDGVFALLMPKMRHATPDPADRADAEWTRRVFGARTRLAVELHRGAHDDARLAALVALAAETGLVPVAAGDVHMHVRARRALQDALTAVRLGTTVAEAGLALFPNGERHLRNLEAIAQIYPAFLIEESVRIANACTFSLDALRYEYPHELVPPDETPTSYLRRLTLEGAARRWPEGVPPQVAAQVEHELAIVAELKYEYFFLTVHDVVAEARRLDILCQGRGSAANSAVCFCLGITEVDPAKARLLFARFLSKERNEPPDIDVDFEHERREEIIQYVYAKYGRHRAALAATVVTYRPKSALRDVGKALGLTLDQIERFGKALTWWDEPGQLPQRLIQQGFDPASSLTKRLLKLVDQLLGFPRHLSQHVGGFVISEHPLSSLVPVENAAMPDRTIIQWDKDDLEALGLLKVDCLALGMLTALRRAFDLVASTRGVKHTIASIEHDDRETFEMIRRADTIGVFQIESRAQMSMLPRLKPEKFYDLVVEVAIVRPGPIQGKMVHPYLRRRSGAETVVYPSEKIRPVLERTLGVPIFQEQVMDLAIVAAGFKPDEADGLRRAMAAWKRHGGLEPWRQRLFAGMREHGYDDDFCERIFEQIKGFGSYGFPESHAASFAKLAYVSAWLKCHEPAAFTCALLNSQPMGFYAPSQLVQDAQRHGITVHGPDVRHSDWDSTLASTRPLAPGRQPALRLGLRQIRGLKSACAERIVTARAEAPFRDVPDLVARAKLDALERGRLADAGALRGLAGHRHRARWAVQGADAPPSVLERASIAEERVRLKPPTVWRDAVQDYETIGLTLGPHPIALLRRALRARHARSASELGRLPHGTETRAAGLVIGRQHPEAAGGATFVTLEDETGVINIVIWLKLAQTQRRELLESKLLAVDGKLERIEGVQHLIAHRLHTYDRLLGDLRTVSRDFH